MAGDGHRGSGAAPARGSGSEAECGGGQGGRRRGEAAGPVGVKTGGSRVGGPDMCVKADGNRKQGTQMFTQVRALSMEVKPYFLLD